MAKKSPARRSGKQPDDARFEAFLKKQFAELRRELEKYPAGSREKDGKLLQMPGKTRSGGSTASWKYGIAAVVLAAVAVPMVLQLNQQKAELAQATAPSSDAAAAPEQDKDSTRPRRHHAEKASVKNSKKTAPQKQQEREEEKKSSGYFTKRSDDIAESKEETLPGEAQDIERSRAPAAKPAAPAASRAMPKDELAAGASSSQAETEAPAPRSISIDDAKTKLKKQDASDAEKAEMERLWKEFEKDPETFSRDRKRSERLKALLARHEAKSKTRVRRVRAAEAQHAY